MQASSLQTLPMSLYPCAYMDLFYKKVGIPSRAQYLMLRAWEQLANCMQDTPGAQDAAILIL